MAVKGLLILSNLMERLKRHFHSNTRQCENLVNAKLNEMQHKLFRHACSIQEDDRVVITGGHSARTVSVYDENGWIADLPNLIEERLGHACTSFVSEGKKVNKIKNNTNIVEKIFFKDHDCQWRYRIWWSIYLLRHL